jgi:predicted DNA binding CopG/RHH family protein
MKNNILNKEEKELLKEFDSGNFKKTKGSAETKELYKQYAKQTLLKSKSINIRISERDLQKLKSLAAEKGLPYQTLISSLLHQYTSRESRERVI